MTIFSALNIFNEKFDSRIHQDNFWFQKQVFEHPATLCLILLCLFSVTDSNPEGEKQSTKGLFQSNYSYDRIQVSYFAAIGGTCNELKKQRNEKWTELSFASSILHLFEQPK